MPLNTFTIECNLSELESKATELSAKQKDKSALSCVKLKRKF